MGSIASLPGPVALGATASTWDDVAMSEVAVRPEGYPAQWEADVVLRTDRWRTSARSSPTTFRGPAVPAGQSEESIYLRFFAPLKGSRTGMSTGSPMSTTRIGSPLVATIGDDIIGIGRYDVVEKDSAEVAFNISDHYQGRGIGSILLEHLAAIAHEGDIRRFVAEVLPQNRKMLNVFREAGYEVSHRFEDGVVAVGFDITPTARSQEVRLAREHRAESISMRRVLYPHRSRSSERAARRTGSATTSWRISPPPASPGRSTRSTPRPTRCSG